MIRLGRDGGRCWLSGTFGVFFGERRLRWEADPCPGFLRGNPDLEWSGRG
jgi:hypothetical protein